MGIFDFFKKTNPVREYLDGFFKDMEIIDVIGISDIPTIKIDGIKRLMPANIFFEEHSRVHRPIASFNEDVDVVFWIFETFFVFEIGASSEDTKQFIVTALRNKKNDQGSSNGFGDRLHAMESSIKIMGLLEALRSPSMEMLVFKEAWSFFVQNHDKVIALLEKKYS